MIRINLLPIRESRLREAIQRELILGGLALGILMVLCGAVFLFMQTRIGDVQAENKQLQAEIDNLKTIVDRVDEIDNLKQELTKKLQVITQLKKNKVGPVNMMDQLAEATPEKLTLLELQEQDRRLTLQGFAVSNEVISVFLSKLEASPWFEDVYLIEIDQDEIEGYTIKNFSITAQLVVEEVEMPDEADDGKAGKGKQGKR